MTAPPIPPGREPLFEAISMPHASMTRGALVAVIALLGAGAAAMAALFLWIGAWPVLGFLGVEVLLAMGLLMAHARWSARAYERLTLSDGKLVIERQDGRGRRENLSLDPYWTRAEFRGAQDGRLVLLCRGQSIEFGRHLTPEERRSLHGALVMALGAWKSPEFDNPQLRGPLRPSPIPAGPWHG